MAMAVDDDDDDDNDNECTAVSWQPNDLYDNGPNHPSSNPLKCILDCIIVMTTLQNCKSKVRRHIELRWHATNSKRKALLSLFVMQFCSDCQLWATSRVHLLSLALSLIRRPKTEHQPNKWDLLQHFHLVDFHRHIPFDIWKERKKTKKIWNKSRMWIMNEEEKKKQI